MTAAFAVAGALAVAVHLGLGGVVLAKSRWTGPLADVVLVLVAGKILFVGLGRLTVRRRHRRRNVRTERGHASPQPPPHQAGGADDIHAPYG